MNWKLVNFYLEAKPLPKPSGQKFSSRFEPVVGLDLGMNVFCAVDGGQPAPHLFFERDNGGYHIVPGIIEALQQIDAGSGSVPEDSKVIGVEDQYTGAVPISGLYGDLIRPGTLFTM